MRRLPPLNSLKAFEAAARHVSASQAAAELHVTHGAISRQIAALENWFGMPLFIREKSRLLLTPAGRALLRDIGPVFDRIELAALNLLQEAGPLGLTVNAPPTFTMVWLIPRISVFQRLHPEISIRLTTSTSPIDVSFQAYDLAIRGADQPLPDLHAVQFLTEEIVAVCHPDLLEKGALATPESLRAHMLISYATEPYSWQAWLDAVGLGDLKPAGMLKLEQMYFALQAAGEGLGVALIPYFLAADDIAANRLCMPFGMLGAKTREYFATYPDTSRLSVEHEAFCAWLQQQGAQTMQLCAELSRSAGTDGASTREAVRGAVNAGR
jgi:LysR family glycine cleavage system transcriptional activator